MSSYLFAIIFLAIPFFPLFYSIDIFYLPKWFFLIILNLFYLFFKFKIKPKKFKIFHILLIYLIFYTSIFFILKPSFLNFSTILIFLFLLHASFILEDLDKNSLKKCLKFLLILINIQAIYGIFQYFNLDLLFQVAPWASGERMRMAGTIGTPAIYGIVLGFGFLLSFYLFYLKKNIIYLISTILFIFALTLNNTRSALFGIFFASFYFLLKKKEKRALKILLFLFIFSFFAILSNKKIYERWTEMLDLKKTHSASIRLFYWEITLKAIKERPFLGFGPESFSRVYFEKQAKVLSEERVNPPNVLQPNLWAHNDFLQIWLEYGIFAFLLFLYNFFWNFIKNENIFSKALSIFLFITAFFLFPFYNPSTLFLIVFLFSIPLEHLKS